MFLKCTFSEDFLKLNKKLCLKVISKKSNDGQNVHTPFLLCKEIIDKSINSDVDLTAKILVVSNLEFIIVLIKYLQLNKISLDNLYYSTPCKYRKKYAIALGIKEENIYGPLLETEIMRHFDFIVGNPPYQSSDDRRDGALWPQFIAKTTLLLKENGFLCLLVPSTWTIDDSDKIIDIQHNVVTVAGLRKNIFDKVNLIYVSLGKSVNDFFNVGVDICYFVLSNSKYKNETLISTDKGIVKINLNRFPFVPYNLNGEIISILEKTILSTTVKKYPVEHGTYKRRIKNSELVSIELNDIFKYPFVTTSAKYSKGIYAYTKIPSDFQFDKKVIWSNSGYNKPFYDDGKFGLGDHAAAILVDSEKEAENLIWMLTESKLIKFLQKLKVGSGYFMGISLIQNLIPQIKYLEKCADEDLYMYFNLSNDEIELIEKAVK